MAVELTFIGLVFALVFTGITGIYPGGIIVPGYLVLFIDQPGRLAATLVIAVLTAGCYHFASRYVILFGRRRLVFMLLTGGVLVFASRQLLPLFPVTGIEFRVIGWIIPGLIANHIERQGTAATGLAMITVTVLTYMAGLLLRTLSG